MNKVDELKNFNTTVLRYRNPILYMPQMEVDLIVRRHLYDTRLRCQSLELPFFADGEEYLPVSLARP